MWIIFSQISAVTDALATLLAKKSMESYNSTVVSWFWVTSHVVLLGGVALWIGIPDIQPLFWNALLLRVILDTCALLLYTRAIQLEEVSLVNPLMNFSAVFSLIFSFLINGELPSTLGIIGVLLIVLGAYFLNFEKGEHGFLKPVINILKKRGSLFMILSAFLFGIIFSVSKVGIEASNWSFYSFASAAGLSVTIFPVAYYSNKKDLRKIIQPVNAVRILPLGAIDAVKILTFMITIKTSLVGFADAANNTSIIYAMLLSNIFLSEKIRQRIIPVLLMFLGLILIVSF